jgi:hypothetical protein
LEQFEYLDLEKPTTGLGIVNGYAGEGILRLILLHLLDLSWMKW